MRAWRRVAILLSVSALAAAPTLAAPPKDTRSEAQKLYEKGLKSYQKGYYDDAIATLDKVRNNYPFDQYAVEAELIIADALFKKHEFGDAADAYRSFAKLHPKHEKIDYATFRIGLSLFEEAPRSVDRDQSSTEKSLEELRTFIATYPESKYADEAAKKVAQGRDRLAGKELYVGRFYVKHKRFKSALGRLDTVLSKYPDTDSVAEATFLKGTADFHLGDRDGAKSLFEDYLSKYPGGKWARESRTVLARMGASAPVSTPAPSPTPSPTAEH